MTSPSTSSSIANDRFTTVHKEFSSATLPLNHSTNTHPSTMTIQRSQPHNANTTSQSTSQSSLVHLSSFQQGVHSALATNGGGQCARKPTFSAQPPKPPERSCSFKDVEGLQQQQQMVSCTSPPPILENQELTTAEPKNPVRGK